MSFLSGGNWTSDPREAGGQEFVQKRRSTREGRLAEATVTCPRCDAPVAVGRAPITVQSPMTCPFCGHGGAVRDFVSMRTPTRPTRVVLRVSFGGDR